MLQGSGEILLLLLLSLKAGLLFSLHLHVTLKPRNAAVGAREVRRGSGSSSKSNHINESTAKASHQYLNLFLSLFLSLSLSPSLSLSLSLCIYLSIYLSICLSIFLAIYLPV